MKLSTMSRGEGTSTAAVLVDGLWRRLPAPDVGAWLQSGQDAEPGEPLTGWRPVNPLPSPGKVVCCGLNYADHITETGRDLPTHPTLFAKYADTLIGPDDDIVAPDDVALDWEAELAVVVGRPIHRAGRDEASAAIAGYTVANDISVRDWQRRTLQWFQGKAWDRTTPVGPVVVTPDELDPAAGVAISCRVNGEVVQSADTRTLVFDCAALLSYISTFTLLRPGDLVLTGTPGGVGMAMDPPRFLADGDLVETEIDGIGVLRNRVRLLA
ncbi:acylpyruvate hydrolase [Nonomuraea maritima]|uniref:Acylpyruvate hydrolase n=1 Tax=Nonomuraea maritima TaxID=683260 RepID=A0A1G9DDA8_9ACTN|nr:fumarylacetoacetate hydrolase family protein [Nonomuraea maritima]SDK61845.1 acylpyruvate hydrolase [Nonomuraea maritima]